MHNRSELEKCRTLEEMQEIINTFEDNYSEYPTKEVLYRTGVAKDIIEEYIPLFLLVKNLQYVKFACLASESNPGPDALILFEDGSQASVQITCAGENKKTSLQRKLLKDGQIVFPNQLIFRDGNEDEIIKNGRVLTTPDKNTTLAILEILHAIDKKTEKYREGTQYLLISLSRAEITMTKDWKQKLCSVLSKITNLPYDRIYVATNKTCFMCEIST